ncbi:DUF4142 domain-containing protein [Azospirillum agricola]|uniref:DUF4142 domain-containing protein n=1 Tax=Azospirillum agricola TaxID=1720247 RepID=UPI000A0F373C|nr:DUF4142 domain-containing protein [Azospirillum agricola]SMH57784.1 putative membrane protein [Azospirillum lipoferum]
MKHHIALTTAAVLLLSMPAAGMAQQTAPAGKPAQDRLAQSQPSQSQPTQDHAAPSRGPLSQQDSQFLEKAAISDQFEIQAGRLAADKAQNADVKAFGRRMAEDHGKTAEAMKALAQRKAATLPTQLDAEHRQKLDRLNGLSGAAFDSAYVQGQIEAHRTAVALFDRQIEQGQDIDLKRFAQQTLPTLQEHLNHIQEQRPKVASADEQPAASPTQGMQANTMLPGDALAGERQTQSGASLAKLIGANVYDENGDKLGDVADVILDAQSGSATAVILDRGGVLGIGAKHIALDYALLDEREDRVIARQITEEQVRAMPEFRYEDTTVSLGQGSRAPSADGPRAPQ